MFLENFVRLTFPRKEKYTRREAGIKKSWNIFKKRKTGLKISISRCKLFNLNFIFLLLSQIIQKYHELKLLMHHFSVDSR